jgi:hypothetical protein
MLMCTFAACCGCPGSMVHHRAITWDVLKGAMYNHSLWGFAKRHGVKQPPGEAYVRYTLLTQGVAAAAAVSACNAAAAARAAAANTEYLVTSSVLSLSQEQQDGLLAEVAAFLAGSIAEQRAAQPEKPFHHIQIAKLIDVCNMQKPELAGRLGLFHNWVGYFLGFPEIFSLARIIRHGGCAVWDPHDPLAAAASPEEDEIDRQWRHHLVGLKPGAAERLLWDTALGQRLGGELMEQVVELLKQRGVWEEAPAEDEWRDKREKHSREKRGENMDCDGINLEEVISMVPKELIHCFQVGENGRAVLCYTRTTY